MENTIPCDFRPERFFDPMERLEHMKAEHSLPFRGGRLLVLRAMLNSATTRLERIQQYEQALSLPLPLLVRDDLVKALADIVVPSLQYILDLQAEIRLHEEGTPKGVTDEPTTLGR